MKKRDLAKEKTTQIRSAQNNGWEYLQDEPEWVVNAAIEDNIHKHVGKNLHTIYHGDTFVYRVESTVKQGTDLHVYRKLKSEYFDTTRNEGTCPNCQKYVKRLPEDEVLTCHRCGWEYWTVIDKLKKTLLFWR